MPVEKDSVKSKTLLDGTVVVENARGRAVMSRLGPGVLLYVCSGVFSVQFYAPMVAVAQREADLGGKLLMIVDGWDLRSVDTGFREKWTEWFRAHRRGFVMRLLVRSKLMEMAASVANLFTGITVIRTYSNVSTWEEACARDFPKFRRNVKATGTSL